MSKSAPIQILNKRLSLYQADDGLKTSTDSVLLAAACPAKPNQSILDLGCGVGSAGFCVLTRVESASLCGIDIQSDHIAIAQENASLNNLQDRCTFITHDIREESDIGTFDHVICNPPYHKSGAHLPSPSQAKAIAMGHLEEDINIQNWITFAWAHIKGQGSLTIIHDAAQTDAIVHALYSTKGGRRFGHVEIIPVFSKLGLTANRVIVRAWKHKKSGSILHSGIIMHQDDGAYSAQAELILRGMGSII